MLILDGTEDKIVINVFHAGTNSLTIILLTFVTTVASITYVLQRTCKEKKY